MPDKKAMVKHNINFLEYPLWFQDERIAEKSESGFTWSDRAGYIYHSGYKIPTKTDGIFLLYLLLQSQLNDYSLEFTVSRYQVLKACGVGVDAGWYDRLTESLNRWLRVDLSFSGKFFDGKEYQHMGFHILEAWKLDKESKHLKIRFSAEFLEMMKGRGFFKYLNFNEFKRLRAPLATRLYEILSKSFHNRDLWECEAEKMAQKIPMNERFPADIIPKIRAGINRINKYTTSNYDLEIRRPERGKAILVFRRLPDNPHPETKREPRQSFTMPENDEFKALVALLPSTMQGHKTLLEMVKKAFDKFGFQYVARNIHYANRNAKTSYRPYLNQALKHDYGLADEEDRESRSKEDEIKSAQQKAADLKQQKEAEAKRSEEEQTRRVLDLFKGLSETERDRISNAALETIQEPLRSHVKGKKIGWERTLNIAIKKVLLAEMETNTRSGEED